MVLDMSLRMNEAHRGGHKQSLLEVEAVYVLIAASS
jgi:hypothetical protein